jgi:membrane protease YdiL (CAAX protease family)
LRASVVSWSYRTMPRDFLLIFFVLALIVPWRGWARLQRLLAVPSTTSRERIQLYLSSMASQWLITIVVAWRAFAHGLNYSELALQFKPWVGQLFFGLAGAAAIGVAHWFNLRRVGRSKNPVVERVKAIALRIFPHSNRELAIFCGLAVTAGICEEFIYRGFVMGALLHIPLPTWSVLLISSVLFGLAHTYQGRSGVIGTLLLGTVFGLVRILYHSLLIVVLWHAAIDIIAGFAGKRYLIENK